MPAKGGFVAAECNGIIFTKWRDKIEVSFISTICDNTLQIQIMMDIRVSKPKSIGQYDLAMGGGDMKDQIFEPYLMERNQAKNWCMIFFKRLQ
ncbi:hypothetical protein Cfor_05449, partial [Coptotermes formosanus]